MYQIAALKDIGRDKAALSSAIRVGIVQQDGTVDVFDAPDDTVKRRFQRAHKEAPRNIKELNKF